MSEPPPGSAPGRQEALRTTIVRSAGWQVFATAGQAALQIAVVAILARILDARDFGVMGGATVFTSFAALVAQSGVAPSLVQRSSLTERHIRFAFTVAIALGLMTTACTVLASGAVASWLRIPELARALSVLSLSFLLSGAGAVASGLLQREMRFRDLARAQLAGYGIGYAGVAIVLAATGFGYWALVFGTLAQQVIQTACLLVLRPHPMRPLLGRSEARDLGRFGGGYTLAQLLNFGATQGDYIVVSRLLGVGALGVYSRAYQLMMLPAKYFGVSLAKVLFPAMSSLQLEHDRLGRLYARATMFLSVALLPLCVLMVICAPEIVRVALGSGWDTAIAPFLLLSIGIYFRTSYKLSDALAEATGAVYPRAVREAVYVTAVVGGAIAGARHGLTGVALGVLSAIVVNYALGLVISLRILRLPYTRFATAHLPGLLLASIVGMTAVAVRLVAIQLGAPSLVIFLAVVSASGIVGAATLLFTPRFLARPVRPVLELMLEVLPNRSVFIAVRSLVTARLGQAPSSIVQAAR